MGEGVGGGSWNIYSVKRGGLQFFTGRRVMHINCIGEGGGGPIKISYE